MNINAASRICAVIGDPVEHSLSPQIHNAAFRSAGINYAYVAFHVKRGDLKRAMEGVKSLGIRGMSVTIPHKIDIIPYLDQTDEVSGNVGSVNTVVNEQGRLLGYSTDGHGALRALEAEGVEVGGRRVVLLGSGGAARAIAFALATVKPLPHLTILGIEDEEREQLCRDLRSKTALDISSSYLADGSLEEALGKAEILCHATPVGMSPKSDQTVVPSHLLHSGLAVFDAVYTPFETRLLKEAKAAGAVIVPGLGMFVHQAAIQFELWTGQSAPVEIMTETVKAALGEHA
ncbi:MAG: shikimate dehydrogenase [Acidobacteriota bacterium]|nr:MAG: shikimate dehydrogenase [Acidobacteriota bacterium]